MRDFGSISKLPSGKWRAQWVEGGRRRSKTFDGPKRDAELFLAHRRIESDGISYFQTYRSYWEDAVLPSFEGLQPNTVHGYMQAWAALEPRIGGRPIDSTTYREAERVLRSVGAPSLQRKCYVLWKRICNMAVRDRLIATNPIDRTIRLDRVEPRKKVLYAREDVPALLDAIRGTKAEALVLLEVGGGLRHEEACAICAEDIERRGEMPLYAAVSVSKALVCVNGMKYLKGTKNGHSERLVMIGEPFASRLLDIAGSMEGPLSYGNVRGDGSMPDHYASPETVSHNWKSWCARNGVKWVRFGDMRSVFATLAGEAGALDSLVSMAMGHAGTSTKSAHYQRLTAKGLEIVADCLTDYLA